jgi:hypothetical protein
MPAPLQPKAAALPKSERQKIAAAFLKSAQWSVLTMRGTRVQDKPAPEEDASRVTMRVFAKGCPAHALREVIESLAAETPVAGFVADGVSQHGEWYHRASWWARDAQASKSGDATMTVYREMSDGVITEINVVEDGCGNTTTIRFVWDASEVEDYSGIAHAGEQGYAVRIAGVNRDSETGLFSYYITTTERKTQYLPEHKASGDAFTDVYASDFMGLRGTVAAPTDNADETVTVPTPGVDAPGTMVTAQWGLNLEDCTLNAQVKKQVAKPGVTAEESCARDLFSERDSTTVRAEAAKLGHAPAAAGGVVTTHQSQLRPDQKYDNRVDVDTEKPVSAAQESRQEDLFEQQDGITDRNQAAPLGAAPTPAGGVIVQHSWDKTPGGLYNNRKATTTEKPVEDAQESRQEDLFSKKDGVTDRNQAASLGPAPAPAGGVIVDHSWTKTPGGLYNNQKGTTTEKPVSAAQESRQEDLFEQQDGITDRNQAAPLGAAPTPAGGVIVQHSWDKTPGGLYNNRKATTTEKPVDDAQESRQEDLFSKKDGVTDRNQAAPLGPAPAPAGGVIVDHSWTKTPGGLYNNQKGTTTEKPVSAAQESRQEDLFEQQDGITDRNQAAPLGAAPTPAGGVIVQHSWDKTPGGLYNNRKATTTEKAVSAAQESRQEDIFSKKDEVTDRNQAASLGPAPAPAGGVIVAHSWTKTPGGLYNNQKGTTTEKPVSDAQVSVSGDASRIQTSTHDKSVSDPGALTDPNPVPGTLKSRTRIKTPGGLYDVQDAETVLTPDREVVAVTSHGSKTYTEEQSTQVVQNATAATPVPAFVDEGDLVDVRSVKNQADLFDVTTDTKKATPRVLYGQNTDDRGTFKYCVYRNQAKTWRPTWYYDDCSSKEFTPNPNAHGLIDGTATQFISVNRGDDAFDMYLIGWQEYPLKKEVTHIDSSTTPMTIKTRLVPYTVYEKDTAGNYSEAHHDLADKLAILDVGLGAASYNVSKVSLRTGKAIYKITIVGNLDTANAEDEVTPTPPTP